MTDERQAGLRETLDRIERVSVGPKHRAAMLRDWARDNAEALAALAVAQVGGHAITDPNAPLGYQCGDPACREHGTAAYMSIINESSGSRAALNPTGPCVTGTQVRGTGLMDVPPATRPLLPEAPLPDGLLKVADELDAVADRHMPDAIIAASLRVDAGWVRRAALAVAQVPAQPDHPFKDEWSFQRRMSKGNPEAGKPISPDQPCFICEVPYAEHEPDPTPRPEPLTGTWHCPSCGQQVAPMATCEVCGVFGLRYERAAFATAPPAEGLAKALAVVIGAHHHAQHSVSTEFMECSQPACALSRAALAQARPSPEETSHD